jgi:hypothetical protein
MRDSESSGCGFAFMCGIAGAFLVGFPISFMVFFETQAPILAFYLVGPAAAFFGFVAGALLSQIRRRK